MQSLLAPSLRRLLKEALREDLGSGDVTTRVLIPRDQRGEAQITAKGYGIFCGAPIVQEIFRLRDPSLKLKFHFPEGSRIQRGKRVVTLHGRIQPILEAERLALNFLGHLSGIATLTHQFVEKVKGTAVQILDTRKTTPLWREFEKYAVRVGGGRNHRFGLWDEVLVKDNHWAAIWKKLEKTRCQYFSQKLTPVQRRLKIPVEVEVRSIKELIHLVEGTFVPDRILLDNFSVRELRRAVLFVHGFYRILKTRYRILRKRPLLEASGGVTFGNVRKIAKTGVDRISIGRLTHSAPALDFSLNLTQVGR